MVWDRRLRRAAVGLALVTAACGTPDPNRDEAAFRESLKVVEQCPTESGFTSDEVLQRYEAEPAFRRAIDACADDAGIRVESVLGALRRALVASGDRVDDVAACMAERDHPMQIEHFPDGSAAYGDLDRYFTRDTMDEFFDDFANCSNEPRHRFPTEAERDEATRIERGA